MSEVPDRRTRKYVPDIISTLSPFAPTPQCTQTSELPRLIFCTRFQRMTSSQAEARV